MAEKRTADIFAGEGSIAGKLRKRREAIESGDASGGQQLETKETEEIQEKMRPQGSGRFSMNEINRGYRKL